MFIIKVDFYISARVKNLSADTINSSDVRMDTFIRDSQTEFVYRSCKDALVSRIKGSIATVDTVQDCERQGGQ